jgi:hypothetical protein
MHPALSMEEQKHLIVETRNELLQAQLEAHEANHTTEPSRSVIDTAASEPKRANDAVPGSAKRRMGGMLLKAHQKGELSKAVAAAGGADGATVDPGDGATVDPGDVCDGAHSADAAQDPVVGTDSPRSLKQSRGRGRGLRVSIADEVLPESDTPEVGTASRAEPEIGEREHASAASESRPMDAKPKPHGKSLSAWGMQKRALLGAQLALTPTEEPAAQPESSQASSQASPERAAAGMQKRALLGAQLALTPTEPAAQPESSQASSQASPERAAAVLSPVTPRRRALSPRIMVGVFQHHASSSKVSMVHVAPSRPAGTSVSFRLCRMR